MEWKLRKLVKGEPMRTLTEEEMEEMGSTCASGLPVRSRQQGLQLRSVEKDMPQRVRNLTTAPRTGSHAWADIARAARRIPLRSASLLQTGKHTAS
jgi:hypothetical protein